MSANARPWFKCYIDEEIVDTRLLSLDAGGAYFVLMLAYFSEGCVPNDEKRLRQITGVSPRRWPVVRAELQHKLFTAEWRHERWDRQIAAEDKAKLARARAA